MINWDVVSLLFIALIFFSLGWVLRDLKNKKVIDFNLFSLLSNSVSVGSISSFQQEA
jgi:flagellar biogenesis protein FliO